jgi:hypothetical protein
MALVGAGQGLLWQHAAWAVGLSASVFTLRVCSPHGLLVRVYGDHTGISAGLMAEFELAYRLALTQPVVDTP